MEKKVRLIAFDVDGTLTDGSLILGPEGEAYKTFFARDGLAIALAHRMGYVTGLITGRTSAIVEKRAEELHMDFTLMGVADKIAAMEGILQKYGMSWEEAAYMGDDLNDLPLLKKVGAAGVPNDGAGEAKAAAGFISAYDGGRGAAREFIEMLLKKDGRWEEAVASFEGAKEKTAQ